MWREGGDFYGLMINDGAYENVKIAVSNEQPQSFLLMATINFNSELNWKAYNLLLYDYKRYK